jgi:hypothetical protein
MKQRNSNTNWKMLFCFLLAGVAIQAHAQQREYLYVYAPDATAQSFALSDIRKITFTEQGLNVQPVTGAATVLPYSAVSKLSFEPWDVSIETPAADDGVKVYINSETLFVESATEIAAVNLYNSQGVLVQNIAPLSLSANLSLSGIAPGVYIVQVFNQQGISSHKILNR